MRVLLSKDARVLIGEIAISVGRDHELLGTYLNGEQIKGRVHVQPNNLWLSVGSTISGIWNVSCMHE